MDKHESSRVGELPRNARLIDQDKVKDIIAIYGILNKLTGKWYIGSTKKLKDRIRRHLYGLRNNQHHSNKLQKAYNKYGETNFEFYLLREMQKSTRLIQWEESWINRLDSFHNGYNCTTALFDCREFKLTKEQIEKRAEKGRKRIVSMDKQGNYIKTYESLTECALDLRTQTTNISKACKSTNTRSIRGFMLCYESMYNPKKQYKYGPPEWTEKHRRNWREIVCYGVQIEGNDGSKYKSIAEMEKHFKLYESYFRCKYRKKWKYLKEFEYKGIIYKKI